VYGPLVISVST